MYRRLFFACITSFVVGTGITMGQGDVTIRPNSLIDSIINPSSLRELVQVLASDSLEGRFTGSVHAQMAASYIANEFYKAGAAPLAGNDGYFVPFRAHGKEQFGFNVMAALKGETKPDEVIIFCAHYDHVGTQSTNPIVIPHTISKPSDSIFNGANDNATGTSAIINLARYFGQLKNNERTILFIAFSGEEQGLLGSKEVASHIQPESVKAVINIEMIGRAASKRKKNAYITGSHLSDLQKLLNKRLFESAPQLYGKKFFTTDKYPDQNLFGRSDNYWFAHRGIPSHTIMATSPNDAYYHSNGDEVSTLDFDLMTSLVKAIAISCTGIIAGIDTPKRINPSRLQ
jgi:Zn-dependent M28 family amino/carboxypeptidase